MLGESKVQADTNQSNQNGLLWKLPSKSQWVLFIINVFPGIL